MYENHKFNTKVFSFILVDPIRLINVDEDICVCIWGILINENIIGINITIKNNSLPTKSIVIFLVLTRKDDEVKVNNRSIENIIIAFCFFKKVNTNQKIDVKALVDIPSKIFVFFSII